MNAPVDHAKLDAENGAPETVQIVCASDDAAVNTVLKEAAGLVRGAELHTKPFKRFLAEGPGNVRPHVVFADIGNADALDTEHMVALSRIASNTSLVLLFDTVDNVTSARLALKLNAADLMVKPLVAAAVRAAVGEALAKRGKTPADVTGVVSATGGAGGTSIAVEIADQLANGAEGGRSTCLIDFDFATGASGLYLDANCTYDVTPDVEDIERIDAEYLSVVVKQVGRLDVLSIRRASDDQTIALRSFALRALDIFEYRHEHLVVDMPHHAAARDLALLGAMNRVFIVTLPTVPALKLAKVKFERLVDLGCAPDAMQVIVNRQKSDFFSNRLDKKAIEKMLEPLKPAIVRDAEDTLLEAVNCGLPPRQVSKRNVFSKDVAAALKVMITPQTASA